MWAGDRSSKDLLFCTGSVLLADKLGGMTFEIRKPTAEVVSWTTPYGPHTSGLSLGEIVAWCARVSNPGNQSNTETMPKLLSYLVNNKHWSPFEMVSVCVRFETTRAITHQVIRHKSIPVQEYSQRYAEIQDLTPFLTLPRVKGSSNRQGSVDSSDQELIQWWLETQTQVWLTATAAYEQAIERGIAAELARNVMPEGMTPTTVMFNASLRSWIHYLEQRLDSHAQQEHRELAQACRDAIIAADETLDDILPGK